MSLGAGCLMVVLCILVPATAWADWLLLLHSEAGSRFGDNWEAKIEVEGKFRDNMREYYDLEVMPWAAYRFTAWFKFGLGWRELVWRTNRAGYTKQVENDRGAQTYSQVSGHYWQVEHRPLADFMFTVTAWLITIEERLRVEYRQIENQDAFFRYRNRLRLRPPWKWTEYELRPWVAWEGYYEDNPSWPPGERLNRHRLFIGLDALIDSKIKTGGYYYYEYVLLNGEWGYNNEIGLEISMAY